jgi:hypothetical protein
LIRRQLSLHGPPDLVDAASKISRSGVEPVCHYAVAVALMTVALGTVFLVEQLAGVHVAFLEVLWTRDGELETLCGIVLSPGRSGQ